jgi:hypothetical protein
VAAHGAAQRSALGSGPLVTGVLTWSRHDRLKRHTNFPPNARRNRACPGRSLPRSEPRRPHDWNGDIPIATAQSRGAAHASGASAIVHKHPAIPHLGNGALVSATGSASAVVVLASGAACSNQAIPTPRSWSARTWDECNVVWLSEFDQRGSLGSERPRWFLRDGSCAVRFGLGTSSLSHPGAGCGSPRGTRGRQPVPTPSAPFNDGCQGRTDSAGRTTEARSEPFCAFGALEAA